MTQNLVALRLTEAQITAVDAALSELEKHLAGLIALPTATKRSMRKMGPKSEAFCRQTLHVLEQNPQIVPPSVALADAIADMDALDQLRPRLIRLTRLFDRASDTEMALGSDVMVVALQGYSLLKLTGRAEGLEPLRQELSGRFTKVSRRAAEPAPQPTQEAKAA